MPELAVAAASKLMSCVGSMSRLMTLPGVRFMSTAPLPGLLTTLIEVIRASEPARDCVPSGSFPARPPQWIAPMPNSNRIEPRITTPLEAFTPQVPCPEWGARMSCSFSEKDCSERGAHPSMQDNPALARSPRNQVAVVVPDENWEERIVIDRELVHVTDEIAGAGLRVH